MSDYFNRLEFQQLQAYKQEAIAQMRAMQLEINQLQTQLKDASNRAYAASQTHARLARQLEEKTQQLNRKNAGAHGRLTKSSLIDAGWALCTSGEHHPLASVCEPGTGVFVKGKSAIFWKADKAPFKATYIPDFDNDDWFSRLSTESLYGPADALDKLSDELVVDRKTWNWEDAKFVSQVAGVEGLIPSDINIKLREGDGQPGTRQVLIVKPHGGYDASMVRNLAAEYIDCSVDDIEMDLSELFVIYRKER